ncbi:hypothetical protein [Aliikangiella maris]|uniref:Arc family DNA binding domain-containing protein n=2 Tax=Aliikangiella maris TaxID=3162458 RepID=A0ABV2BV68_9GAMM
MAKKAYPLRINEDILKAMQLWADDELRSLNAQIEFVLRESLRKHGRIKFQQADKVIVDKDATESTASRPAQSQSTK